MSEKAERVEAPKPVFVFGDGGTTIAFEDHVIKLGTLLEENKDAEALLFALNLQLANLHKVQVALLGIVSEGARKADEHNPGEMMQGAMQMFMDMVEKNKKNPLELVPKKD